MLRFNSDEWIASKNSEFAINRPTLIRMQVSCISPVSVAIDGIPVKSGNEFTFTLYAIAGLLTLKAKDEFGAKLTFKDAQSGEPFDTREVVALAVQGNMLQQIRAKAEREQHAMREALIDHSALNYEIDDDDFRFEEEIIGHTSELTLDQDQQPEGETATVETQQGAEAETDGD